MSKGKRYNQEFKDGVIKMIREKGRTVASIASDLGIAEQTIYRWLDKDKTLQNPDQARIMELEAELKASKRRETELEQTVDILKKATAIFVTPLRN
jgi:transposase-like protein